MVPKDAAQRGHAYALTALRGRVTRKGALVALGFPFTDGFKDQNTRNNFWLYERGLDKKQSKKRLIEPEDPLMGVD